VTAQFDPLRDEGQRYAETLDRFGGMIAVTTLMAGAILAIVAMHMVAE